MKDGASPGAPAAKGRGALENPANRFERLHLELDPDADPRAAAGEADAPAHADPLARSRPPSHPQPADAGARLPTELLRDTSRSLITRNDSPDVGFTFSLNPYRGCEHGCIYCYARPTHEYLGFSAGLGFESRILVKEEAPRLLAAELAAPSWQPETLVMSGVTDPYQPVERRLGITRGCLEVLAASRHPVAVITKSELVTRDLDLLVELARHQAVRVMLSVTTLDGELARRMEPRASHPRDRLKAVARLAAAGVPVGVMVAPVVPAITDHEIPAILEAAAAAGARAAGYTVMRLPGAVAGLFEAWLERHFPDRREKVLHRIRELRGGKLNDPRFGSRMRGEGIFAQQIRALFESARRRHGLDQPLGELSAAAFRRPTRPADPAHPATAQLQLFG
ncbi:MAG: PA0069 family radical SAM protein [Acidobacteria bacterium]|nr:PA0069 family radical SAM protein [Acidobacteriota bacterium]